ncbi:cytochrome P450 [Amycolatopsis jejuensis]|uniref:cytochrome P450 n=1 Tax=Amycolatopsis jejuensis TaxID=330084 RepID=UPI0005273900|nr:cytochrome P450 [Amycolatopsis jejuensis]
MAEPAALDLTDRTVFTEGDPNALYAELRRRGPVWRNDSAEGKPFWAIVRYRELLEAYADTATFSSVNGVRLGTDPSAARGMGNRMLIVSDPPHHGPRRKLVSRTLTPETVRTLVGRLRTRVAARLDHLLEVREFDFARELAREVPESVIGELLGIPETARTGLATATTEGFESPDDRVRRSANARVFLHFEDQVSGYRRDGAADDAVGAMTATTADDTDVVLNAVGLLFGGNETTRHALSAGLLAFIEHPDQYDLLRSSESIVDSAVEEVLRWTTPAVYVLREVLRPVTLGGVGFRPGDQVALWNAAGNQDEDAFARPEVFDVTRTPNRHLALGHGRHVCIGSRLAKLEIGVVLTALRARVRAVELTGAPVWNGSNFTRGLLSLPIRLISA